jgi:hypothetical protein
MMFFKTNPLKQIQTLRNRAERLGLRYLEGHAVKGTITRAMVMGVAKTLNQYPDKLIEMIPDRRRPSRHAKAMEGLRKASRIGERQTFADRFNND